MHESICCKKAGLNCFSICKYCLGETCENAPPLPLDSDTEDQDTQTPIDILDEQLETESFDITLGDSDPIVLSMDENIEDISPSPSKR